MPYTEPLDPATPSGGSPVSGGDDAIRQLKRSLIERLESVFVDIDADPLVLKAAAITDTGSASTQTTGLIWVFPAMLGGPTEEMPAAASSRYSSANGQVHVAPGSDLNWDIPLVLPNNVTLKKVRLLASRGSALISLTASLVTQKPDGTIGFPAPTIVSSTTGFQWLDTGAVSITIASATGLILRAFAGGSASPGTNPAGIFSMVEVTFDLPS